MNIEIFELLPVRPDAIPAAPALTRVGIAGLQSSSHHGHTNVVTRRNSTFFDLIRLFSTKKKMTDAPQSPPDLTFFKQKQKHVRLIMQRRELACIRQL